MLRHAGLIVVMLVIPACAPRTPVVTPEMLAVQRVAEADALVLAGCFDCLEQALAAYEQARVVPATAAAGTAGAVRAAALRSIRARELGLTDSGYLRRAQELAATRPELQKTMAPLLEVAAAMPMQSGGQRGTQVASDAQITATAAAWRNREAWTERLRGRANEDALTAYLFLAFGCSYDTPTRDAVASWLDHVSVWREVPLMKFRTATCGNYDALTLDSLLAADTRFLEANYFLGLRAILGGKLDEAADQLQRAYAWRAQWPGVTHSIANVHLTAEDFDQAILFFDRTIELSPDHPDALLGKAKALTYLGRSADAIATLDQLLALERWYVGDARYWRAVNEVQLARHQEAWDDVELAGKLLVNAQVPKLAGVIAYHLKQLETARAKFEESKGRNPQDCETAYYLGVVLGDLRSWAQVSPILVEAADCLQSSNQQLRQEIDSLRASEDSLVRKARQIAKREQTITQQERMLATSWFNTAVAYYNLQQKAEAQQFAEKVASDQQFGERAREILNRVRP